MEAKQLQNLRIHTIQLSLLLIRESNPDGIIRTRNPDGLLVPDVPATHHLVEVLARLDKRIFTDGITAAVQWLMSPENGVYDHPFALDSLLHIAPRTTEYEDLLRKEIADRQLKDGSIPIFAAFRPGGDYFSTLWAVKIMSRYSVELFQPEIDLALEYLLNRRDIGPTSESQLGFLGLLLAKIKPNEIGILKEIAARLIGILDQQSSKQPLLLIDKLFILEDLMAINSVTGGLYDIIDSQLIDVFELSSEAQGIPQPIENVRSNYTDSLFFETLARCAVVGIERCVADGQDDLALSVNALVHSDYRETRYTALKTSAGLRKFLERYGSIHEAFSMYDDILKRVWEKQPFDNTIFLMMPFQEDHNYRTLTNVIKKICSQHGYSAIRVDDPDRQFSDRLWDNLVINMLASKYAIAVYVSEPVVDRLRQGEVRLFANPNVALEFGFFKSRGQDVLLLKDKASELPSDLTGFLWSEFDIKNPDKSAPKLIEAWLNRIK